MDFQTIFSAVCGAIIGAYGLYKGIVEIREHTEAGRARRAERKAKADNEWTNKVNEIVKANIQPLQQTVDEIHTSTLNQEKEIQDLKEVSLHNQKSQMDLMRAEMNKIYYRYLPYKKILDYDRKAFLKLYEDYRAQNGNTWIVDIHDQLIEWPVVTEEEELKGSQI